MGFRIEWKKEKGKDVAYLIQEYADGAVEKRGRWTAAKGAEVLNEKRA